MIAATRSEPSDTTVRVSRVIGATPEALWSAWTDPQELMLWWRQEGDGWAFAEASVDLRVGGAYRLGMIAPDGELHVAAGTYCEVLRPVRLAFTWDWENPLHKMGRTLVTIEFNELGPARTELVLTHEQLPEASRSARHRRGWIELLALLERRFQPSGFGTRQPGETT